MSPWPAEEELPLLTDLYQLTMLQSYWRRGMGEPATFELFVRHLPPNRRFLVACGLLEAIDFLESLRFDPGAIDRLRSLRLFDDGFLRWLGDLRFAFLRGVGLEAKGTIPHILFASYQGTFVSDLKDPIRNLKNARIGTDRQREELDALRRLNELHREERLEDSRLSARIESFELAHRMQLQAPDAFDLSRETATTNRLYGIDQKVTEVFGRPAPASAGPGRSGHSSDCGSGP